MSFAPIFEVVLNVICIFFSWFVPYRRCILHVNSVFYYIVL